MMEHQIESCLFQIPILRILILCLNVYFFIQINLLAQPGADITFEDRVKHRVILTANTADIHTHGYYQHLESHFLLSTTPFSLLVNGDLVDKDITTSNAQTSSASIKLLLQTISGFPQAQAIVLPGDRDWSHSGKNGLNNVASLEQLIKSFGLKNVKWAIDKGCPGPKVFMLADNVLLITINTQWWNHPYDKPQPADATCNISTEDDFLEELQDILDENEDKNILIAGHYPIISRGEYGGTILLNKHLFPLTDFNKRLYIPLPILGSMYVAYRKHIGTPKDIGNEKFTSFRQKLQAIFSSHNNLVYLSGHEHNLQILQQNTNYFINSGAPEKGAFVSNQSRKDFTKVMPGLIEIWFYQSGKVEASIYEWNKNKGITFYSRKILFQSACQALDERLPVNQAYVPCDVEKMITPEFVGQKQIHPVTKTLAAGSEYKASTFKKFLWGSHYRDAWTASVTVPVLDLDTTYNGLQVYKKGGGRQTNSLHFKAANGKEYIFRSVNKDPSKALRYELRETILSRIVRDQTTTQHPYGAMAIDVMLNKMDVLHAHPKLYVLPDDNKLGPFQKDFAHLLGMLEEKPSVPKKGEKGFAEAQKIVKSYELFRELYNNPHAKVDAKEYARARIFDILVGDWGKHEDNWKWALYTEKGNKKLYRPIPRDRDHAFSRWDGLIPWLADRKWAKPSGENFGTTINDIRSLTWQSRHLDRFLATELTRDDWLEAARSVQKSLTKEVIEKAIASMPSGEFNNTDKQIIRKLNSRIKDLDKYALAYYRLLATYVDVVGSNEEEYFDITRKKDGSVEVRLYESKRTVEKMPLYQRTFYPSETKEIRLYGLKGNDVFVVSGESKKSIKLRIIGGPGNDKIQEKSFVQSGGKKTFIYEQNAGGEIELGEEGKKINHPNPQVYNYNRTAFSYPTYFPSPYISYNQYNGIEFSMGMQFKRQKFGKSDYSLKHQFRASATTQGNFVFDYSTRFHHLIRKWDLELEGIIARPENYNFFFGVGNETVKNDKLFEKDYYLSRYNRYELSTTLIRDFWKRSSFAFRLSYGRNEGLIEANRFVNERDNWFGIAPLILMESGATLDLDFRDNPFLPANGMRLLVSHQNGIITNTKNTNYGISVASIEQYSTLQTKVPITLGLKVGGADSYGKIPFYKLPSLGQLNDLRGYVRHRFTGNGKLFFNSEMRLQLLDIHTSIVPMKVGIKGFYDVGRVYVNGENSKTWHKGYGGGLYIIPLDERFTCNASVSFSKEESPLILVSIGRAFR